MVLELTRIDQGDGAIAPSEHIQIEIETGQPAVSVVGRGCHMHIEVGR